MCGIVGILQYKSEVPKDVRNRALRILFSDILIRTEERGKDATGIYQVHANHDWMMNKKGIQSSKWAFEEPNERDSISYSELMDSWGEHASEISALVGHCRKATIGSKGKDNNDNHPFAIQLDDTEALLGIHNGTLENHEVIYDKLPEGLTRKGKTDSEVLFHFLYHMTEQGRKPVTGEVIKEMASKLEGAYACIVVNSRFPNIVSTFRENRPMEYYMVSPLNIVLIVSEKRFAVSALENYKFIREFLEPDLPELEYGDRTLAERDWRVFDTNLPFPEGKPAYGDWDKISTTGEIKKIHEKVPEGWSKPKSITSVSSSTNTNYGGRKAAGTSAGASSNQSGTPGSSRTDSNTVRASKSEEKVDTSSSKSEDVVEVEGTIIELDVEAAVPKKVLERVKSLGICTNYDSVEEINRSLGLEVGESAAKMSTIDVANNVAQLHFAMGYATSAFDNRSEKEELLRKSREILPKLEIAVDKKKKAESHIWEHKQLLLFLVALSAEGFSLDLKNVGISLSAFKDLAPDKKKGIMTAARKLFNDEGAKKLVNELRAEYIKAEKRLDRAAEQEPPENLKTFTD